MDQKIDEICDKIDGIKEEITQILKELRQATNSNAIVFAHNRKYRYQVDVPADCIKFFESNPDEQWMSVGKFVGGRRRFVSDRLL
jgi:hypothetical protein